MFAAQQRRQEAATATPPPPLAHVEQSKDFVTAVRFGFLIHDVSRLRRVVIDRVLKPVGITRSQWWVLSFLGRRDGMNQTALAADLDLTKVAVGGLLDRMESAGFVERRPDPRDSRSRRVYLTLAGTRFLETIRVNIGEAEQELLAEVSSEDLETTARTLRQLKRTLLRISSAEDAEPEV